MDGRMNPFNAYDIRGIYPDELNRNFAARLGVALAREFRPRRVIIGHDCRLSSPGLAAGLAAGLKAERCALATLGLCCTEEIYYAAQNPTYDLGIMITGSHNPVNENGFKIVRGGAVPVSSDSGLGNVERRLREMTEHDAQVPDASPNESVSVRKEYCQWLLDYTGLGEFDFAPLKIIADCGNGCAGLLLAEIKKGAPFELVLINDAPDGHFPNGVPNPLLPEKREGASLAVREHNADLGIAFDGDADRCFFYDHQGRFIEGYYLVGLLAEQMLRAHPGEKIIHDPRLYWNTKEIVESLGGVPIPSKTGHAFIKERMRSENAIYGGEMSAHHYFRDFGYCDSGMLPWLLVASLLQKSGRKLEQLVGERNGRFPCSGEINRKLGEPDAAIRRVRDKYAAFACYADEMDGVNMEFADWRFSLRKSNTEPLLRLNVESRGNAALMEEKTREILSLLEI